MEKRKYEFKSIVAETLLIPLYMRAKESRRANPILKDSMAERLVSEIDYDYSKFDNSPKSETGCLVRGWYFDRAVRFSGGEIWFDVCGSMMTRNGMKPDSLRNHEAQIRSGIDDGRIVQEWIPELEMICQDNYMAFFRNRWQFLFGHVIGRMKKLCFKFSSLLGYRIKGGRGNGEN